MKNKKLLYILLPATFVLWGAIIYKIIGTFYGDDDPSVITNNQLIAVVNNSNLNDTFSIHPTYRDPFFGKMMKINSGENHKVVVNTPAVTVIKHETAWPTVLYQGLIKNQKLNKELVLVLINGQNNTIKLGDKIGELELTKVFKDSIEFKLGKEKRFFRK
jgi:hypothetical protein